MQLDIKKVFTSILDAVVFLHQNNIFHQDLTPKNILITSLRNQTVKVADFGSATTNKTLNGNILTTVGYAAPELLFKYRGYSLASNDVWSLGVILLNLITREVPWREPRLDMIFGPNMDFIEKFEDKYRLSDRLMRLFRKVFARNEERPTVVELRSKFLNINQFNH